MIGLTTVIPREPLAPHVAMIWDCNMKAQAFGLERILPKAGASLIINLAEDETRSYRNDGQWRRQFRSGSVLVGPGTRHFVIDTAEQCNVIGVEFQPGGAGRFFRESLDRLKDADTDLGDLAPCATRQLRERLLEANSAHHRIDVLTAWLLDRLHDAPLPPVVVHALEWLQRTPRMQSVAAIAAYTGLSVRRISALFTENIGVGPKRFLRLQRFGDVIACAHSRRNINWSTVAVDCGYHDQSHLVHEFREFSGLAPSAWLTSVGAYARHVPIDAILPAD